MRSLGQYSFLYTQFRLHVQFQFGTVVIGTQSSMYLNGPVIDIPVT